MTERSIHALMAAQHGVVGRAQALGLGLTPRQVRHRLATCRWVEIEPGAYRAASSPDTWYGRVLAACLAGDGVASHRCAAALWHLDGFSRPPIEVTVPSGSAYRTGPHRIHQSTQWDRRDECRRDAIPCTGLARTILDLCAVVSLRRAELAAESAIRQELIDWPALYAALIRHSRRGRNGCGRLRSLLELRYGDDEIPLSGWSRLVANLLTDAGIPPPRLEYPVVDQQGTIITRLDLAWPLHMVGLELDSVRYHLNRRSFEKDRRKRNRARLEGWTIHEVTWSMSVDDQPGLIALVRQALQGTRPSLG